MLYENIGQSSQIQPNTSLYKTDILYLIQGKRRASDDFYEEYENKLQQQCETKMIQDSNN